MKVTCPKCQYENQTEMRRVVCVRCATIIEVKQDQGLGLETNGKRQTARLPFVGNVGNSQPLNVPPSSQTANPNLSNPPSQPNQANPPNPDVYATRVGDDFDDVLDIPRPPQTGYQAGNEPVTAFEDVFAMPNYDTPTNYDFPQEKKPTTQIEGFPTGPSRQRSTQDYGTAPEPEFMGWPVLPENGGDEQEQANGFSSNRGALFARVALGILVFGLISFLAYYFLGNKLASRSDDLSKVGSANNANNAGNPAGAVPTYPPATVPSLENKPSAADKTKPSPTAAPSSTQQVTGAGATGGNGAQQQAAGKPPAQTSSQPDGSKPVPLPPIDKSGHSSSPKPAPPANASVPPTPGKGNLTIQIASFSDQAQANSRVAQLGQANVNARVVQAEVGGKTWYRVQIGGFQSRDEAMNYAKKLKAQGTVQDFIVTTK